MFSCFTVWFCDISLFADCCFADVVLQHTIQHLEGPSFQRLGGGDKLKVGTLYVGVLLGLALAVKGQTDLWVGANKVERN